MSLDLAEASSFVCFVFFAHQSSFIKRLFDVLLVFVIEARWSNSSKHGLHVVSGLRVCMTHSLDIKRVALWVSCSGTIDLCHSSSKEHIEVLTTHFLLVSILKILII